MVYFMKQITKRVLYGVDLPTIHYSVGNKTSLLKKNKFIMGIALVIMETVMVPAGLYR